RHRTRISVPLEPEVHQHWCRRRAAGDVVYWKVQWEAVRAQRRHLRGTPDRLEVAMNRGPDEKPGAIEHSVLLRCGQVTEEPVAARIGHATVPARPTAHVCTGPVRRCYLTGAPFV